jgi:hypothetical protein
MTKVSRETVSSQDNFSLFIKWLTNDYPVMVKQKSPTLTIPSRLPGLFALTEQPQPYTSFSSAYQMIYIITS